MSEIENLKDIVADLQFVVEKFGSENENLKEMLDNIKNIKMIEKNVKEIELKLNSLNNKFVDAIENIFKDVFDEVDELIEEIRKRGKIKEEKSKIVIVAATSSLTTVFLISFFIVLNGLGYNFFVIIQKLFIPFFS